MLKTQLKHIQKDLSKHHRDKKTLKIYFIQARLNKSLASYYSDLSKSAKYLEARSPINVAKKL